MTKSPLSFVCICIRERPWFRNVIGCIKTLESTLYQKSGEDLHRHSSRVYPTPALAPSEDGPLNTVLDGPGADLVCYCRVSVS